MHAFRSYIFRISDTLRLGLAAIADLLVYLYDYLFSICFHNFNIQRITCDGLATSQYKLGRLLIHIDHYMCCAHTLNTN